MSSELKDKSMKTKKACILYFVKKIVLLTVWNTCHSEVPQSKESKDEATQFVVIMHEKVVQMDPISPNLMFTM